MLTGALFSNHLEWPFCIKLCLGIGMEWYVLGLFLDLNVRLSDKTTISDRMCSPGSFWHYTVHAVIRFGS